MDYEERNAEDVMVFMKLMEQYPEVRQMPQIFFKGERIGGFAGLREWIKWKEQQ
jgi:glutaredoxin